MHIFRYWAHAELPAKDASGNQVQLRKWRGSNTSAEEALDDAKQAVAELARRITGIDIGDAQQYYGPGVMPEELMGDPSPTHALTRNRYGCLVLNAESAMFVDVDMPAQGWLSKTLFGDREKKRQESLHSWLEKHPGTGLRIYRTAAGFRYLFTHKTLPVTEETLQWQKELGADKLYMRLCKAQQCYRARLTPKPWRMKHQRPPNAFPRQTPKDQAAFDKWLREYEHASRDYATCRLVESRGEIHPDLENLIRLHDDSTRAERDLPLA